MAEKAFQSVAIIGVGLIGSSLARAIRKKMPTATVKTFDASEAVRARLSELSLSHQVCQSVSEVVTGCDLVVLATPLSAFETILKEARPNLSPGAIVSDVGSAKKIVLDLLSPLMPEGVHLVPAHPVAGTEKSGPDAGFAELFENRWCIITPPNNSNVDAIEKLNLFWSTLGSKVEVMSAQHHDLVLATTSHIPHLIAYSMVGTASDLEGVTSSEVIKYSAGGFRDFTRIAASDPTMWRDVFLLNKDAVLEVLGRFSEDLAALQRAIRWGDSETLFKRFTHSRDIRKAIIDAGQDK